MKMAWASQRDQPCFQCSKRKLRKGGPNKCPKRNIRILHHPQATLVTPHKFKRTREKLKIKKIKKILLTYGITIEITDPVIFDVCVRSMLSCMNYFRCLAATMSFSVHGLRLCCSQYAYSLLSCPSLLWSRTQEKPQVRGYLIVFS